MTRLTLIALALLTFVAGVIAGFNSAASAPTTAECEKWAEAQPGYGTDAVENILKRDTLIRACLAGERV